MAKNVKYVDFKDNKTDKTYTLKLTYKKGSFGMNIPEVKILLMEGHNEPTTFWDRLVEPYKYYLGENTWNPFFTDLSLEDYCKQVCANNSDCKARIEKVKKEWGQI